MSEFFSPISRLAQELIDEIMDYFSDYECSVTLKQTLVACTLVCRAFSRRSQKHMFSKITVTPHDFTPEFRTRRVDALYSILERKPHLGHCIRDIRIALGAPEDDNSWITEDVKFLKVMMIKEGPAGIRSLLLVGNNIPLHDNLAFEKVFWRPFIAPFVTSLQLSYMHNFPVGILAACHCLKTLSVSHLIFDSLSVFPPGLNVYAPSPCIEMFKMTGASLSPSLFLQLDFSHLRSLECEDIRQDIHLEGIQSILERAAGTLEKLSVRHDSLTYGRNLNFNIGSIPNLSFARFSLLSLCDGALEGLCNLLGTTSSANNISRIEIEITAGQFHGDPVKNFALDHNWGLLDHALKKVSSGKMLQVILFVDYIIGGGYNVEPNLAVDSCHQTLQYWAESCFPIASNDPLIFPHFDHYIEIW